MIVRASACAMISTTPHASKVGVVGCTLIDGFRLSRSLVPESLRRISNSVLVIYWSRGLMLLSLITCSTTGMWL